MLNAIEHTLKSFSPGKELADIYVHNKESIYKTNYTTARQLALFGVFMFTTLSVIGFTTERAKKLLPVYLVFLFIVTTMFILIVLIKSSEKPISLLLNYLFITITFAFGLIISVLLRPQGTTTTFIVLLVALPLMITDRPWRVNLFIFVFTIIFIIASISIKEMIYWIDDVINGGCCALLGMLLCSNMNIIKIRDINNQKLLLLQRDTDSLTSLLNRRKLFERLAELENNNSEDYHIGIMMIDIDYFKLYNDTYGHQMGDTCLKDISVCFTQFSKDLGIEFYRYGGEEFLAISIGMPYSELRVLSNRLLKEIQSLELPCNSPIANEVTISIGFAEKTECSPSGYESLISMADEALYYAKQQGRNRSQGYLDITYNHILEPR